jgi:type IV pilus assembly protein PilM
MDLKKEIKLGDLVPRRRKQIASGPAEESGRGAKRRVEIRRARSGGSSKRLVGLKIGASQIAAAHVANDGAVELLQAARDDLAPGIVVGGEVRNPEALADALSSFFARHKLPRRGVRLGIANNRIGVRAFDLNGIEDPRQLTNAVRFRAHETLPIPIEEAALDYQILSEGVSDTGETLRRVLLVVTYRELVDRFVSVCSEAGVKLAGIDLEAFALLRALASPDGGNSPDAALVAVSVGHERSTFAVSEGRVCEFTRVLEWGGSTLNVAIARALDMAPSEAEAIKRSLSVVPGDVPAELTAVEAEKAQGAIRREIQAFARELVSSLQYYQNQPGSLGIGEIVLTGGTAHLQGFAEQLEQLIGVTVRLGDPLVRVRQNENVAPTEQLGSLTVAIGLGIEE